MTMPGKRTPNLNDAERKVLIYIVDRSSRFDPWCYPFAPIMSGTDLDRKSVRRACRSLARKGLTEFHSGLWSEDGEGPAGAGYSATLAAFNLMEAEDTP